MRKLHVHFRALGRHGRLCGHVFAFTERLRAMMYLWLCGFPMTLALMALWQEQLDWHHNYLAVHKLYVQAKR
jgi:hypothetical protein